MPNNAAYAYNYLRNLGYNDSGAAAIVGNFFGESGVNPSIYGDSGAAYGAGQWHFPRQQDFANIFGRSMIGSSLDQQLQFTDWELKNKYKGVYNTLMGTGSVQDKTYSFMRGFERPANDSSFGNRLKGALSVMGKASGVMDQIKGFLENPLSIAGEIPGVGGITNGLGITGDCNWLCQFKKWLAESHFWQRVAIVILALIVIAGSLYLLGSRNSK